MKITTIAGADHDAMMNSDWGSYREVFFGATQSGCVRVEEIDGLFYIGQHSFDGDYDKVQTMSMQDAMSLTPDSAWIAGKEGKAIKFAVKMLRDM